VGLITTTGYSRISGGSTGKDRRESNRSRRKGNVGVAAAERHELPIPPARTVVSTVPNHFGSMKANHTILEKTILLQRDSTISEHDSSCSHSSWFLRNCETQNPGHQSSVMRNVYPETSLSKMQAESSVKKCRSSARYSQRIPRYSL
jgi:hypothetical protein